LSVTTAPLTGCAGYEYRSRHFQDSSARKCPASEVPANFSCIRREESSMLRGRWFTTMCSAFPAALRVTVTMTLRGSPWT
jgi:hypothetical protein